MTVLITANKNVKDNTHRFGLNLEFKLMAQQVILHPAHSTSVARDNTLVG